MFKFKFNLVSCCDETISDVEKFMEGVGAKLIDTQTVEFVNKADNTRKISVLVHTCQGSIMSYFRIRKRGFTRRFIFDRKITLC